MTDITNTNPAPNSRTTIPPSRAHPNTPNKKTSGSSSKVWIAGVIVGPIAGLALLGAILLFLFRRHKNKKNAAAAATGVGVTPSAPPPAHYKEEVKPQFAVQQQPAVGVYNVPQNYPASPAPQYSAPYAPPGTAPVAAPVQGYDSDVKYAHMATPPPPLPPPPPQPHASELGGTTTRGPGPAPNMAELRGASAPAGSSGTAELSGEHVRR